VRTFICVRADEIKPGEQYTLKRTGRRTFRVTAMPTPSDVRDRGRVLVRFEEGVLQGELSEQLPRFIVAPADAMPTSSSTPLRRDPRFLKLPAAWPPNAGDLVMWPARTGPFQWRVLSVDRNAGEAMIAGRVLEMDQKHTVPLGELESMPVVVKSNVTPTRRSPSAPPRRVHRRLPPVERDERTPLERAVDRLEFTLQCLRQYHREFEPRVPWPEIGKRLRRELRNQGRLVRRSNEYLRVRTRRFEIVISGRPSDEEPCVVQQLIPLATPKRRYAFGDARRRRHRR
jgi:hypothetical protein